MALLQRRWRQLVVLLSPFLVILLQRRRDNNAITFFCGGVATNKLEKKL
jgi:hypothetical protein